MAAMNFDQKTVSDLMSLIDDHKDDVNEADYIKICNAMKYLHQRTTQPQPQPQPQPQEFFPTLQRTDFPPSQNRLDLLALQNRVRELRRLKTSLERSVQFHLSESRNNGRLILQDKHNVLINLLGLTDNFNRTNFSWTGLLKEMEKHVFDQEIVTLKNLKTLYYDEKNSRMHAKRQDAYRQYQIKQEHLQNVNRRIDIKTLQIQHLENFI